MRCHIFLSNSFVSHPWVWCLLWKTFKEERNAISAGFKLVMRSAVPSSWVCVSWLSLGCLLRVLFVGRAGRGRTLVLTAGPTPVPLQFAGRVRPAGEGQGCSYRYPCLSMGKSSVNWWQNRFIAVTSLALWVILPFYLQGPWQDPDHTGFSRGMILPSFLAKEGGWLLSQFHTLKSTSHPSSCNGCASTRSVTFSHPEEKMCDSRIGQ